MAAGLKEQCVGNDRADGGHGDQAGQRVLGAVQQHAHHKVALGLDIDDRGLGATTARSGSLLADFLGTFLHRSRLVVRWS